MFIVLLAVITPNSIEIKFAPLLPDYQLNVAHIEQLVNERTKIIWICSPNNPTGNSLDRIDIETILNHFDGIVPCGVNEHGVTSLVDLGLPVTMDDLDVALKAQFIEIFGPVS